MSSLASIDCAELFAPGAHEPEPLTEFVGLRSIGIDDWSDVRYVHATSFRAIVGPRIAEECADAYLTWIASPDYVDHLRGTDLTGVWLDGRLAGTAGWRPMDSANGVARIEGLFVQPLFAFMGLGSLLLAHAEARARRVGYNTITALASSPSVPFFLRSGYDVYAQGPGLSGYAGDLPMFVMRKQEPALREAIRGTAAMQLQRSAFAAGSDRSGAMLGGTARARGLVAED